MSFITPTVLRAHIDTALEDDALQVLIDAEESVLTRRIGPLAGAERTDLFQPYTGTPIVLRRPTTAVTAEDDGVAVDVTLASDGRTVTADSGYWTGPVAITYSPADGVEVWAVLIELMRLRVTETAYTSEATDSYSYDNDATLRARRREGLIRSLLPKQLPSSVRVASSVST